MAFIMSQECLDVAKGRTPMTYNQYLALLKSRAHELDNSEKTSEDSSHKWSIQTHEHGGHSSQNKREDADEEPPYDCNEGQDYNCLLYTSPSPRDGLLSRMPSSA